MPIKESPSREPRQEELLQKGRETLEKLYRKRKNCNMEKFSVGDSVWMQNPQSKKWVTRGTIVETRVNQDDRQTTFVVKGESGREYLSNECMLQLMFPSDPEVQANE